MLEILKQTTQTAEPESSLKSSANGSNEPTGDPYVPLRKDELIDLLVRHGELDDRVAFRFRKLCRLMEAILHQELHLRQEQLKTLYAPFDPDAQTRPIQSTGGRTRADLLGEFLSSLVSVLEAANYRPLTAQELETALSGSTYWGLDLQINREIFDRLMIFVRGDSSTSRARRDVGTWFRRREVDMEIYDRLVLAVKLRPSHMTTAAIDTDNLYLKMFRDIPKLDLEMLLPGTRPRMRWFDSAKIGGSSITGLYGLFKVAVATVFGKFTWAMIAIGALSYAIQSFIGYRRTKAGYIYSMTQQLYYQNLDNNIGVFCRVIDEAEDEETKEAILAYYFLWRWAEENWTPDRLAVEVDKLLRNQTGDRCRFQAREAIAKLERLGVLVSEMDRLQAIGPEDALSRLSLKLTESLENSTTS